MAISIRKTTTFVLEAKDVESPKGPSMTVPDMTMSLKTLLDRHSRGLEIPMFNPTYSDEELPDLERMDLAEIQELKDYNAQLIQDYRRRAQFTEPSTNPVPTVNNPKSTPESANDGEQNQH